MNPRRRQLVLASGALAAAPALFNIARAQGATIKIGFPVPLTGAFCAEAQDQVRAAELAVKEWNAAGGHKGQMAELLVRDTKLNPGEAATRTLELIEKDKVNFVVGSLSAATQLSINAVTRERKVLFNSISQSDTINEAKDWSLYTFHEALNPHLTAGAVARYAFPKFGKKIVYLTADYAYGHEMVRGFQRAGQAMGAQTLADIRHPLGAADYSAFLPRIQALKPDILVLCNFGRDLVNSAKQATDFGLKQTPRSSRRCCCTPAAWPVAPTPSTACWAAPATTGAWKTRSPARRSSTTPSARPMAAPCRPTTARWATPAS